MQVEPCGGGTQACAQRSLRAGVSGTLGWVSFLEKLFGHLAEAVDECDGRISLQRVVDRVDVDGTLVEERVKDVVGVHRCLALLFVAEDEIDPLVETIRDKVWFQGLRGEKVRREN